MVYPNSHPIGLGMKTLLDPTSFICSFIFKKELLSTDNAYDTAQALGSQWSAKAGKIAMLTNAVYSLVGKICFDQILPHTHIKLC